MDERDYKAMNKNAQKDVKPMEEKKLTFEEWKKECQRLLFELDTKETDENIHYVDQFSDMYKEYYDYGMTPQEGNQEQYLRSEQ